jgi:micrococcal nuclease
MTEVRRFWRWVRAQWASGSAARQGLLIVGGLAFWPFLFVGLLIAAVYEGIAAIDRGSRLGTPGQWAIAATLTIGVLLFVGQSSPRAGTPTADPIPASPSPVGARADESSRPTPTATPTATPTPTPTPPLGYAPVGPTETATVLRVIDGDTIEVDRGNGPEKVRYIGIDTPETVDPGSPVEWMGPEASAANATLVEGKEVVLERDVSETDQYGRLLRYVWITDPSSDSGMRLVNLALIADGYAQVSTYPPDVRYADLYLAAQRTARRGELGLWQPSPEPSPTPRPSPSPTPVSATNDDLVEIATGGEHAAFRGSIGTYAWNRLSIEPYSLMVRWDVSGSSSADCRVAYRLEPTYGDAMTGTVKVAGGQVEKGSRKLDTSFISDAAFVVSSTCGTWLITLGDADPPSSGGGGGSGGNCDPSYPSVCIPPYPPDLDCGEIPYRRFEVLPPDPHGFDGDNDGIGCERD